MNPSKYASSININTMSAHLQTLPYPRQLQVTWTSLRWAATTAFQEYPPPPAVRVRSYAKNSPFVTKRDLDTSKKNPDFFYELYVQHYPHPPYISHYSLVLRSRCILHSTKLDCLGTTKAIKISWRKSTEVYCSAGFAAPLSQFLRWYYHRLDISTTAIIFQARCFLSPGVTTFSKVDFLKRQDPI